MYETASSLETIVKRYEMYCELALSVFIYIVFWPFFSDALKTDRKEEGKGGKGPQISHLGWPLSATQHMLIQLRSTHELALCYHK